MANDVPLLVALCDHVNGLQWRFTKSTRLSTILHSQLPKVRLASRSQQSFLHKVSPSFCAIFSVFSDVILVVVDSSRKCPQKVSTVLRSPERGLENLRIRDKEIEDSQAPLLQKISRCYRMVSLFVEKFLHSIEC